MKSDVDRWSEVLGRLGLGEPLSPDDAAFVEAMRRRDPTCDTELAFLEQLSSAVDGPADPLSGGPQLVRAALARADDPRDAEVITDAEPPRGTGRKRRWIWLPAAAAAAACVALGWWMVGGSQTDSPSSQVRLTLAAGDVYVDGKSPAHGTAPLGNGSTIAVTEGSACFDIDHEIDVCLGASTTVSLHDVDQPARWLEVHRGHAVARLEAQDAGHSFSLVAGDVRAAAVGTIFSLDVSAPPEPVAAAVLQGVVRLEVAGDVRELTAHEVAIIEDRTISLRRLSAEQEAGDLELLSRVDRARGADLGQVVIECVPTDSTIVVDGIPLGGSPVVAALPIGEHRVELVTDGRSRLHETLTVEPDTVIRRRFELSEESTEPDPSVSEAVKPVDDATPDDAGGGDGTDAPAPTESRRRAPAKPANEMLSAARRHRQAGDWKAAARIYRQLWVQHPQSSEAHTGLVSLGDLQLDRLGQPMAAARSYERYLKKGGDLAHEARLGRIRAYRAAGDTMREAEAIRAFIQHHPDSGRVDALEARLAQLGQP